MAKGSDNPFPSVLVVEGTTPATPAAGDQRLFINSSNHHLERVDSSGTVTDIEAGGGGGTTFSGCRVYNSANISVATGGGAVLTFDSELFDTDAYHSTVTNTSRLTVPTGKGGYFEIFASIAWASNSTGVRQVYFLLNGTTIIGLDERTPVSTDATGHAFSTVYHLADADYVEIHVAQTSGGALNVSASTHYSPEFGLARLGT